MTLTERPARILSVDDNQTSLYVRGRILTAAGFDILSASSGQQAIDLVHKHSPDLVLLDVHLPDIDGVEVCRRLKSSGVSIIVIQISATSVAVPQATESLNNGADAYLSEPVDPDVLVATVRAMLRLRKSEKDLAAANEELATLNQELRRSNEDLEQFAFLASHDLQEPLRTVTTYVQLIQEETAGRFDANDQQYFAAVLGGAERMRHLIDALLIYSQVRDGSKRAGIVNMNDVVALAVEHLDGRILEAGATVNVSRDLPLVQGDASQLVRVVQNLISNAIKYAMPNQPVSIDIYAGQSSGSMCQIFVHDDGSGIAPAYHNLIFMPFKRLHGADIPGAGIGLAVCRRIIEGHGGRIAVESEENAGATFSFTLPTVN
jgi:signal transduction histidine kinase